MSDKTKITGLWWLPENPSERWTGTLTIGPEKRPRLKLVVPKSFWIFENSKAPKVIHGHDTGGVPITILFPGMPMGTSSTAISQPVYSGGYVIRGIELNDASEFRVNSLTVKMQHLHEWICLSGFQTPNNMPGEFSIRYNHPEKISFQINDDLSVEFGVLFFTNNGFKKRSMEEDSCVVFKSKSGFTLNQCFDAMNAMRYLLHFASLDRVYPISISATKEGYGDAFENQFFHRDIHIYSSINHLPKEPEFDPDRWLFRFPDLKLRFGELWANWLAFIDKFHEPLGSYSATIYHQFPSEMQHLCLAQALEAYDGIKFGKRDFIGRIKSLASQFTSSLSDLIPDIDEFAKTVRDNRNYFTHHDPKIKENGRVVSGASLIRLNEKMRLIFQMCILAEIGVPSDRFIRLRRKMANEIIEYLTIK